MDKLKSYKSKRDFSKTKEPSGGKTKEKRLVFAVQHHLASRDHYDFRLAYGGVLLSWAVPKGPSYNPADKRLAVRVEDHPYDYKDFEGTIPKGEYGGGIVMLWDYGYWQPYNDAGKGIKDGALKFELFGQRLKGKWTLVKLKDDQKQDNWLLIKEKDSYALNEAGIAKFSLGVKSGRSMEEIADGKPYKKQPGANKNAKKSESVNKKESKQSSIKNPFSKLQPELAQLVKEPYDGNQWLYEIKYDGYRIISFFENGDVRFMTRGGKDYTDKFSAAAESLSRWNGMRAAVLDGEMTVLDQNGKSDFQALQKYIKKPGESRLTYMAFDILAANGKDLRQVPLQKRKEILENFLVGCPREIMYSKHIQGCGKKFFEAAKQMNLEGIVGKKADSPYTGGRGGDWIKIKCGNRQEFVICGYTVSDKRSGGISSLILGVYEGGNLIYSGRAGTGFDSEDRAKLMKEFKPLIRKTPPFTDSPKMRTGEKAVWLNPEKVAEISFAEWTDEGALRQASFKGLRSDKPPKEIKKEVLPMQKTDKKVPVGQKNSKASEKLRKSIKNNKNNTVKLAKAEFAEDGSAYLEGIKITNPQKILYGGGLSIRKVDVAEYYAAVSERMLKFVKGRVLSIVRCPKGICDACFFKKHPDSYAKGIHSVSVRATGGDEEYFYIDGEEGLIYEAQMGTIEFHIWGSTVENIDKPDMMIFDLDPDKGMPLDKVREGVKDLKNVLDGLKLKSFLKTSGGKGYHIAVPFIPSADWDIFHGFSKKVAQYMADNWPDKYTDNIRKEKRKGKIYVDFGRNTRGATSVAPYSLRARPGAKVSMPIQWEELDSVSPDGINMEDAVKRLGQPDPWADFYKIKQTLV